MPSFGAQDRSAYADLSRIPAETADLPPCLLTVVSTEEEFDWQGPFRRDATTVEAMRSIEVGQALFDRCGVRPTYVVDYPVASQPRGFEPLRAFARESRCEIGAHLHPWVSPPHEEEPTPRLSFPGNLPAELESRKLERLTETITEKIGVRPRSYQAGRYGFGRNTLAALRKLGYRVDLSAAPPFDFSAEQGPDYSRTPTQPAWLDERREMLSAPITGAFLGLANSSAAGLYGLASSRLGCAMHLPGMLARAGVVERVRLSPEGHSSDDMKRLAAALLARGERVLVLSLHSPSFHVGCTPYVRSQDELAAFLSTCEAFYEHVFGDLGGVSMTAHELFEALRGRVAAESAP